MLPSGDATGFLDFARNDMLLAYSGRLDASVILCELMHYPRK